MGIGTSLVLIAIGAILYFAVTVSVAGISISTVGVILMVLGIIGLVISLIYMASASRPGREREVVRERDPVVRERDPMA
jgi:protein-S-isoprenylcysteine O-methyltransferase Ste14